MADTKGSECIREGGVLEFFWRAWHGRRIWYSSLHLRTCLNGVTDIQARVLLILCCVRST